MRKFIKRVFFNKNGPYFWIFKKLRRLKMSRTKKVKSTGRFGSRYGLSIRQRVLDVELKQKGWHQCPKCAKNRVKRVSSGIWQCRSCNVKFAGKAYTLRG